MINKNNNETIFFLIMKDLESYIIEEGLSQYISNIGEWLKSDEIKGFFRTTGTIAGIAAISGVVFNISKSIADAIRRKSDKKEKEKTQEILNRVLLDDKVIKWIDSNGKIGELIKILKKLLTNEEIQYLSSITNAISRNDLVIKKDYNYYR